MAFKEMLATLHIDTQNMEAPAHPQWTRKGPTSEHMI